MWQAQEGIGPWKHSPERKGRRDHKVLKVHKVHKVQSDSPDFRVR